jgi:hypothetical protein
MQDMKPNVWLALGVLLALLAAAVGASEEKAKPAATASAESQSPASAGREAACEILDAGTEAAQVEGRSAAQGAACLELVDGSPDVTSAASRR